MQGIFQKENTDKALKYGIYRHLPTYEKIIRNLVSFYIKNFGNKIKINELEDYLIEKIEINIVNFQEIYMSMVLLKMIQLNNTYKFSKEHDLGKEKDDYEIEM